MAEDGADLVIVYGAMRSGTTVFRLMLDAHRDLHNPGEADFLTQRLRLQGGAWRYDREALARDRIFLSKGLAVRPDLDGLELFAFFVGSLRARSPGRLTLNFHHDADRIAALVPKARFIHLARDPRDVARSSVGMGWARSLYGGVDHWIASERAWDRAVAMLDSERILELRYEALMADVEGGLRRVCAFIGVAYDPNMLSYHERSSYGPPERTSVEQWRRKAVPREIGELESKAGALMQARGYALSGFPVVAPGPLRRRWLALRDRLFRIDFQIRRFGPRLWALEQLSRRLGLRAAHDRALAEMRRIQVASLK